MGQVNTFNQLDLTGGIITEIELIPQKRLFFNLHLLSSMAIGAQRGKIYDLQFNKIFGYDVELNSAQAIITSNRSLKRSKLLASIKREKDVVFSQQINKDFLRHFKITTNVGSIDVVAESFSLSLIWELPIDATGQ